jgi:hypothetical protein
MKIRSQLHLYALPAPSVVLFLLCSFAYSCAQTCLRCPEIATTTASSVAFGLFANRNGVDVGVDQQTLGECEPLIIKSWLVYDAFGISGAIASGFTGGTAYIILPDGTATNVTPDDMATTLVGPAPCGTTFAKPMKSVQYIFTKADIAAGFVTFTFDYTNGIALMPNVIGQCAYKVGCFRQTGVSIAPPPNYMVDPSTNAVSPGASVTFTLIGTGAGPFSYSWSGPNGFSSTDASITITNVQLSNVGDYTAVVADQYGCTTNAFGTLLLMPKFTEFRVSGADLILTGSGGTSNAIYTVLTSTNVGTPLAFWTSLITNTFDATGQFSFTNGININEGERYFRLRIP